MSEQRGDNGWFPERSPRTAKQEHAIRQGAMLIINARKVAREMMRAFLLMCAVAASLAITGALADDEKIRTMDQTVEMQVPAVHADLVAGLLDAIERHPRRADIPPPEALSCTWERHCDHTEPWCDLRCRVPH